MIVPTAFTSARLIGAPVVYDHDYLERLIYLSRGSGDITMLDVWRYSLDLTLDQHVRLGLTTPWYRSLRRPSYDTLRRALARIERNNEVLAMLTGKRLALDGQVRRGSGGSSSTKVVVTSVFDVETLQSVSSIVSVGLGHEATDARKLLTPELARGNLITSDAAHTNRETMERIVNLGGDYVLPVKDNTPHLYDAAVLALLAGGPWSETSNSGHGRTERRTTMVVPFDDSRWPEIRSVGRVIRRRNSKREGTKTDAVFVSTLVSPPAELLGGIVRGHWGIENQLHYVRDLALGADRSRLTGTQARGMSFVEDHVLNLLRRNGWSNITAGLTWLRHKPERVHDLLDKLPCPPPVRYECK